MSYPLRVVFLGLSTAYLLTRIVRAKYFARDDVQRLPGPSSSIASWIWGHELLVFQHGATQMYSTWARTFGGLFKIKGALFHRDIIVATDHAAVHHILAKSDLYVKSPAFRPPIINLLGKGLVWAEGEDWHRQRRILSPAFSQESVKEMTSPIHECAERLETRLTNLILSHSSPSKTLNIVEYISACTLDIIGAVALSHSFSAQSIRPDVYSEASQISSSWSTHVNNGLTPLAFLAPLVVRAIPIVTKAPLPLMQSQGVVKGIVKRLGSNILERENVADDRGEPKDFKPRRQGKDIITILLRARDLGDEAQERLTDEQILDNVFSMVGHETTAGSLSFTLWQLARYPAVQDRLRAEVLSHGRDLSYDDIQKLEYLDAGHKCVRRLRLHPASPQTERLALEDDVIHIPFMTMNTNPQAWGPSASVFDPTRWLEKRDPSTLPHGWSGILTFCDGPRNCLGWRLAVLEFKIILATVIRSIVFEDTGTVVEQKISPTLQPVVGGKGGILPLSLKLV
ncbi:cytochrome P450 [Mycena rebaudengoi]|nr:cytochrome P450 [Mycena rebaudengoi]